MKDIDYSNLIELICDNLELNYTRKENYYHSQSPLLPDSKPSFLFYTDGYCESFNGMINDKNRISIKEVCKLTGHLQDYIRFILQEHNIPIYKLNQYRDFITKKSLDESIDYKKYMEYVKLFGELFISQSEIIGTEEIKPNCKNLNKAKAKKKSKTKIIEIEQTMYQNLQCVDYLRSRKLDFIQGRVEPVTLKMVSDKYSFENLAIAFKYTDGYVKYRLINNESIRYISTGTHKAPYIINNQSSKICIIGEGEMEMESINQFVECDLYAMANTQSLGDMSCLEKYETICVLIDFDTFSKVEKGIRLKLEKEYPDKNILILPKIEDNDKKVDFNYLLIYDVDRLERRIGEILKIINTYSNL